MGEPARRPRSQSRLLRGTLCGVLLVLGAPWGTARAADKVKSNAKGNPYIPAALRLYEEIEYEEALQALDKAAKWPSNTPEDEVRIALLEGILRFELRQDERGVSAFRRALAIDLQAQSPVSVSPKIAEQLEQVRRKMRIEIVAPENPVVPNPPPPLPPEPPTLRERLAGYRLPIAIGGGVVALGGALSWTRAKSLEGRLRSVDPTITTRQQLDGTVREGRTFESVGWVLLGVGAATAVGSLLLLDTPPPAPNVSAAPTPGGAHVSLSWSLP
jgi:hypothetical protein